MKTSSTWLLNVANFLGGILFLVGSIRFYTLSDILGAVVFALAGIIAIALAIMSLNWQKK